MNNSCSSNYIRIQTMSNTKKHWFLGVIRFRLYDMFAKMKYCELLIKNYYFKECSIMENVYFPWSKNLTNIYDNLQL